MPLTDEQLGDRVDQLDARLASVERNMATKDDIRQILDAVASLEAKTAGPVEVYSTTKSIGKFALWAGTIVAAVFGAIVAVKEWVLR